MQIREPDFTPTGSEILGVGLSNLHFIEPANDSDTRSSLTSTALGIRESLMAYHQRSDEIRAIFSKDSFQREEEERWGQRKFLVVREL